jgi:hypothetical protein
MAASADTTKNVFFSYKIVPPTYNSYKEVRWNLVTERTDASALVEIWQLDARFYVNIADAGLPSGTLFPQENAMRSRTIISWKQPWDGVIKSSYSHSGWCVESARWTPATVAALATVPNWNICLRISDGAGRGHNSLQVDPDHHMHCATPGTQPDGTFCDENGENLGVWHQNFWIDPPPSQPYIATHTVPLGSLGFVSGSWHKLVLVHHNDPDCLDIVRTDTDCPDPAKVPPVWSNVAVLPFRAP